MSLPDWPRVFRAPLFAATIKDSPEEFSVREQLGFELSGDGEHDYLHVEKIATNTEWLSRQLAIFADVPAKDIGYSGLKDRNAVTRQWFSVPRWNKPDWTGLSLDNVRILDVQRNARKLRRGAHRGNRFRIVLRLASDTDGGRRSLSERADEIEERLNAIRVRGVPNYFGDQRFGRGGTNTDLTDAWAAGKRLPRHKRSIAISVARSYMFNELLAGHVTDQTWEKLQQGDVANLDGSGSVFDVDEVDSALRARIAALDIHPTGILWGDGDDPDTAPGGHDAWIAALQKARVSPMRRSLRLRVIDLQWEIENDALTLDFYLCRGAYATVVIREIAKIL